MHGVMGANPYSHSNPMKSLHFGQKYMKLALIGIEYSVLQPLQAIFFAGAMASASFLPVPGTVFTFYHICKRQAGQQAG